MKVLAIRTSGHDQGEFVLVSLHEAVEAKRVALTDIALVSRDAGGAVQLQKTKGLFHRHGIPASLLKQVGAGLEAGEAMVVAQGSDDAVDAVGARVRALTGGDLKTYEVAEGALREVTGTSGDVGLADTEGLLREASDELPLPDGIMVRVPLS